MLEMHDVESSQIKRIGYDAEKQVVRVEFKRKDGSVSAIWEYGSAERPFTQMDFDLFLKAHSVGKFFGDLVKGVFPAVCIQKN